jgi:hypothetical protein
MATLFSTVLTTFGLGLVVGVSPAAGLCTVQLFGSGRLLRLELAAVQVVEVA